MSTKSILRIANDVKRRKPRPLKLRFRRGGEGASAPYLPLPFREITCGCVPKFREFRYPRRHFPGKVYEWDVPVT